MSGFLLGVALVAIPAAFIIRMMQRDFTDMCDRWRTLCEDWKHEAGEANRLYRELLRGQRTTDPPTDGGPDDRVG